jgi:hypothetical protein
MDASQLLERAGGGEEGREPHDWGSLPADGKVARVRAAEATVKKHYTRLMDAMHKENLAKVIKGRQDKFDGGGEREVQRFLGKLAPVPTLWGILPRNERRHYPWVLEVRGEGREAFRAWMGEDFARAVEAGERGGEVFHVRRGVLAIHVLARGEVEKYGMSPVRDIAAFLAAHQHLEQGEVRVAATPGVD